MTEPDPNVAPDGQPAEARIQWKNTSVCLDFYCICGAAPHFDDYHAYVLRCVHCGQLYEMPAVMTPKPIASMAEASYPQWIPKDMRDDDLEEK